MCRVLAENPAKLYGLFPRKGILRRGSDADVVVYDPRISHILSAVDTLSAADYTPYEGFVTSGSISKVYLRGRLAVERGKILGEPWGKYMVRGKNCL
jgi:dihydropyrimidinase